MAHLVSQETDREMAQDCVVAFATIPLIVGLMSLRRHLMGCRQ